MSGKVDKSKKLREKAEKMVKKQNGIERVNAKHGQTSIIQAWLSPEKNSNTKGNCL